MAGDQGDGDADVRWLSYAEIAKIRGISRASAERIVRRAKWRLQADNQGGTRAAVPLAYAEPERTSPPDSQGEIPPDTNGLQGAIDALREQQDHERTAWREDRTRLVADLDRERARADTAEDRAGRAEDRAAELRERLDATELAKRQAEDAAELAKQQATHAHQAAAELRQAADARKAKGLVARLRAAVRGE